LTNGKFPVPHLDYKAEVDKWIRSDLPELHAKTTYLVLGFYPNNFITFPNCKPFELVSGTSFSSEHNANILRQPGSWGKWIQVLPTSPDAVIPVSGDINITPGVWTRQIIAKPELTKTKYVDIGPETLSFGEMLKLYGEVTGRQTAFVQSSVDDYVNVWGIPGKEMADQLVFGEQFKEGWGSATSISKEDLGIKDDEWPGFKQTLETYKDQL
jgi:hypothetical protein